MSLHLHHPELTPGPCDPQLVREETERVKRAARFAADVAWDQRQGAACGHLNNAFWAADAALGSLPRPNPYASDWRRLNRGLPCGKCGDHHAPGRCPEAV